MPRDSKETEHGSSNEEASPSAVDNKGIVFVPCFTWKCRPWHDVRAIARARAITRANEEKGSLGGR